MFEYPILATESENSARPLVGVWLKNRKQLLVNYYLLAGLTPTKDTPTTLNRAALDNFLQSLVDYLATGHFNLYERALADMRNKTQISIAACVYPALTKNTEQLMTIYDSCLGQSINESNYLAFQQALSLVGEMLEVRFSLEDKLIL